MKHTEEMIFQAAKKATSAEEVIAAAKKENISISPEKATLILNAAHSNQEISDAELASITGGCPDEGPIVWNPDKVGCDKYCRHSQLPYGPRNCYTCLYGVELSYQIYCNHPDNAGKKRLDL